MGRRQLRGTRQCPRVFAPANDPRYSHLTMKETCIACGGASVPFLRCPDFLTSSGESSIVRCTACGFLWTADAPCMAEMSRFYGMVYEQSIHPPLAHPLLRRVRMEIQTTVRARMVERQAAKR